MKSTLLNRLLVGSPRQTRAICRCPADLAEEVRRIGILKERHSLAGLLCVSAKGGQCRRKCILINSWKPSRELARESTKEELLLTIEAISS